MDRATHQQLMYEANRKSVAATYLLWLFFGMFGAHRFYAGRTTSGLVQLGLLITLVGWLVLIPWLIADLFLIPGMVRDHNLQTIEDLRGPEPDYERLESPKTPADAKRAAMLEDLKQTGYSRQGFGDRRPEYP
jgi:TM2 domain-containing membrane protein YozV